MLFLTLLMPAASWATASTDYDIILRGGRVLDGTGNPWIRADVGIRGDRIAGVGSLAEATAKRIVDIPGLYLCPGFIDVHSHADRALATDEHSAAPTLLAQGITTTVVNPDGGGPVDLEEQRRELERHGLGVNVALMIGHTAVRARVVGRADRAPSPSEMDDMRLLVRNAMDAGAFGVTSGLFYTPGFFATTEEVIELCKVAADFGGVYTSHIRAESDNNIGLLAAVDELIRISREAQLPGIVTHIKASGPTVWGFSSAVVHRIEQARAGGAEVWADQYPYTASSTGLTSLLPRWALAGGRAAFLKLMGDAESRLRIHAEVERGLARRGGGARILISDFPEHPAYAGHTLAALAVSEGKPEADLTMEMLVEGNPKIVSFSMLDADVDTFMRRSWVMTCSDGGIFPDRSKPHPRSYGAFPRKIRHYVLERAVIDLPFAIRSMTHLPASVFRIHDRGMIRPGAYADIVVFDLDRINDPATFDDPHRIAEGMVHVLINGRFAIDSEEATGDKGGRVLHRQSP